jgi:hypothetical protein
MIISHEFWEFNSFRLYWHPKLTSGLSTLPYGFTHDQSYQYNFVGDHN